ncbi:MAG: energy transducer TonB [Tannerellaceae bacterium]|jgi:TonB family protein|nr:energy transducer TonB [Tannerellaceae bacterium]
MKRNIVYAMMMAGAVGITLFAPGNDFKVHAANGCSAEYIFAADDDTTVYAVPDQTALLPDAIQYFRQNNRFKDWDKNDDKAVLLQGIVEKDGTITGVKIIRSSKTKKLDDEALRLIKTARYLPGAVKGKTVRSKFSINVHFPAR